MNEDVTLASARRALLEVLRARRPDLSFEVTIRLVEPHELARASARARAVVDAIYGKERHRGTR